MSNESTLKNILYMRRHDLTSEEMSEALGLTRSTVNKILRAQGIEAAFPISPRASIKKCLACRGPFISTGPGNRLCTSCRSTPEGE